MSKVATKFLVTDPWRIIERGFHPDRNLVAESIFSVGNEFMGVRGYFEEGFSGKGVVGSFFNGIYEYMDDPVKHWFRGPATRTHFLVNAVDWLHTRIVADGETLDLATSRFYDFERVLDMRSGLYTRSFVWETGKGKRLKLTFQRFTAMTDPSLAVQRITFESLDFSGVVDVVVGLDFGLMHHMLDRNLWPQVRLEESDGVLAALGTLAESGHRVCATLRLDTTARIRPRTIRREKFIGYQFALKLQEGKPTNLDRIVVNTTERSAIVTEADVWSSGLQAATRRGKVTYQSALDRHAAWWGQHWKDVGVSIDGDPENEQGVRFGIFQLTQTYHGVDPRLNVAAKGLTGEAYWGHTWWDTETYCLPFYLFTNPRAARNLIEYRHLTLPNAIKRAASDDCVGARYPMSSIDGYEACTCWQHGDLEIHVSAAVAYGIWHYVHVSGDKRFLHRQGIEMLLQICRFYASRGGWGQKTGKFGFYGVMGADEFHMMVNNNCYTNVMAQKTFQWTLDTLAEMKDKLPGKLASILKKTGVGPQDLQQWKRIAANMFVPLERKTGVFEQHEGYFNYPHTDVTRIPATDFPLYDTWSYFRIFRTDMIKQPDVLLLHFFFSHDYSDASKKTNYLYYEPRCSHESSLSPGIHSILAAELGLHDKAFSYWGHAARLDLDDFNRNTCHGLHTTSMAAAWLNVVYGFGGMRSDGDVLSFKPSLPGNWNAFSFKIRYRGSILKITVDRARIAVAVSKGKPIVVRVFGKRLRATSSGISVPMPRARLA